MATSNTVFNGDIFNRRDALCQPTAGVSQAFADVFETNIVILNVELELVVPHVNGERAKKDLVASSLYLLRQVVYFELRCLGGNPSTSRVRNFVRALQWYGMSSIEDLLSNAATSDAIGTAILWEDLAVGDDFAENGECMLSSRERFLSVQLFKALETHRPPPSRTGAAAKLVRRLDIGELSKQQGYGAFPRDIAPSVEMLDKLVVAQEQKSRLVPYFDVKAAPWSKARASSSHIPRL
jgi:hypothetical protein